MYVMRTALAGVAVLGAILVTSANARAQQDRTPSADNTKVNKRDRSKAEPTADQGKNNASDRELMKKIRRAVVEDKSLSTYAHNVKIIAQNGKVTLKGPVRSEEEKQNIEQKATEVAGASNVTNQLTVKAARSGKEKSKTS